MSSSKRQREVFIYREYFESIVVAVLIAVILRTFVVAAYKIPTPSMVPTLKVGDLIFAWKLPYGVRIPFTKTEIFKPQIPKRGEVVIFRFPEDESISFVKRVVGLPGDKIEIRQKRLFINDQMMKYLPLTEAEGKILKDIPMQELYIVQKEIIDGKPHFVAFKRGEDDDSYGPVVVPDGKLFVLGDNRDVSDDSRSHWGMVPLENLEGEPLIVWCSFNWEKRWSSMGFPTVRWPRLFTLIR